LKPRIGKSHPIVCKLKEVEVKRKLIIAIAIVMLAGLVLGGHACAPMSKPASIPSDTPPKTLDIGIITPLTGGSAFIGTTMQNGILLAMDVQNEQGGVTIAGQKYLLNAVIRDSKGDILIGKSTAEEMVLDKGIKTIAGPFIGDAVGVQTITEPNKVIAFLLTAVRPTMTGPNRPYTFFLGSPYELVYANLAAYLQKFYPEAKAVRGAGPDVADLPIFTTAAETVLPQYGLKWLGVEKFPASTRDFTPIISRLLDTKPDIIDTTTTPASLGAVYALLVKQLRQAGFNGIIITPGIPPPGVMQEVVSKQFLTKIVTIEVDPDSPIVSHKAYRDVHYRAIAKYHETPSPMLHQCYNVMKGFFEFLNGQNTMDTTAWMEGFAKYHWQGIYGFESYWIGKKKYGIDRFTFRSAWTSEYTDGKLDTNFTAPVPYDMFVGE
jgi:ABC-type branched-subunit amino acid transport system substrate-binding protein